MAKKTISIDGRKVSFTPGETILDVSRREGVFIPTLCHLKGATPSGACRICIVAIEGARTLAPACATPANGGMVVHTHSPEVLEARQTIIAMLMQRGNHNCAAGQKDPLRWTEFQQEVESHDQSTALCPAYGACKLQAYAYRYQVDTSGLKRVAPEEPMEMASPLIVRDFSRCIRCGRCVDACNVIQVNNAISHGFRGKRAKIVSMGDDAVERSDCVFCGECIQACPVAALVEKKSRYRIRPWEARYVRTTCHFCGVGCQMDLHVKDNRIMKVTGGADSLPNRGSLCIKGRFGYDFVSSPERLTRPMIRKNGVLQAVSWDAALERVAAKIMEIKEKKGPSAIAGICSGKSTNEALYLMQKFFRSVIGTNNLASPYAAGGMNHPLDELERAKRMILVDADVTEENPVAGTLIKRAVNHGCRLVTVNSRPTRIGKFAVLNLLLREGTEAVLLNGMIRQLLERGYQSTDEMRNIAVSFPADRVAETTGLLPQEIEAVLDILDTETTVMMVYGPSGSALGPVLVNLQELLGNMGKALGGVNFLGELNNSQGTCDMGILPDFLPGYAGVNDHRARRRFEVVWKTSLNHQPGLSFGEMAQDLWGEGAEREKKIACLYSMGQNLTISTPDISGKGETLGAVDFLVVQDVLDSENLQYADVVLPAATWSEDEGTYTNCERRVSRMRRAISPPGAAKPETWIFTQLARRLGHQWPERSSREIWEDEIETLVPLFKGITYDRLKNGGLQWPISGMTSKTPRYLSKEDVPLCRAPAISFNYHHFALLEQCEGLLESLPRSGGIGQQVSPSNPREVWENFFSFLEEEKKPEAKSLIDHILTKYRAHKGGLIPVLQQVQEILGFLPIPVQNYIALGLRVPPAEVFGVVSFYSYFTMIPRGKHIIRLCLGTACFVKGSAKLLGKIQKHLKINIGETTADREFSLDVVRCLGACGLAPVMVLDDSTYGQIDADQIVDIIEGARGRPNEE